MKFLCIKEYGYLDTNVLTMDRIYDAILADNMNDSYYVVCDDGYPIIVSVNKGYIFDSYFIAVDI